MKKIIGAMSLTLAVVAFADDSKLSNFIPSDFGNKQFQLMTFDEEVRGSDGVRKEKFYRFAKVGERGDEILSASGRVFKWGSAELDPRGYGASGVVMSSIGDGDLRKDGHVTLVKHQSRKATDLEFLGLSFNDRYLRRLKIWDDMNIDANTETQTVTLDQVFELGRKQVEAAIAKKAGLPVEKLKLNLFLYSAEQNLARKAYDGEKADAYIVVDEKQADGSVKKVKYVPHEYNSFELTEGLPIVVNGYWYATTEHDENMETGYDVAFTTLLNIKFEEDSKLHLYSQVTKLETPSKKSIKEVVAKINAKRAEKFKITEAEILAPVVRDQIVPAEQADER